MIDVQVGFHDMSLVRKVRVTKRINDIINRLNRTRKEEALDLEAEKAVGPQLIAMLLSTNDRLA